MAFYLLVPATTVNVAVNLSSDITQTASGNFEIEFELDLIGTNGIVAQGALPSGTNIIFFTTPTNLQLRISASQRNFTLPQSAAGRHVYRIVSNTAAGNIQVFQDGVSCGTTSGNTLWSIRTLVDLNNVANRTFGLYYFKVRDSSGALIHHYNPSIVLADPNILVDEIGGNNGTMVNFPADGSARVPYDDGTGGEEQITSSGGIASALAGGAASTQNINEQVLSASGVAAAVSDGIASTSAANEQVYSTGGIASAIASASASASIINEQALSSGGIASAIAGATASTQVINEQTSEQVVSSGGIAASIGSASASTQVIHEQVVNSGGITAALAGGVASSTVIEDYAIVQVVQSGGISSAYMSGIVSTSQVVEQITNSGGVAAAVMTGSASTTVREFTGDWAAPEILFSEAQPIQQVSLTFDQLGRPLVFYRVGVDTLKIYQYDPVTQQNVTTEIAVGKDPTACFDFPQDTGQSFTDVLLFYVRDDQVFMRIQRDRYAIEYPCPAIQPGLKIKSAGLRVDKRLQVVYQFKDDGYVPPVAPVPPVEIPGGYRYLQGGYNSGIETPWRMTGPIADTEFEIGMTISGFRNFRRDGLASDGPATGGGFTSYIPSHTLFAITAGVPANGLQSSYGYAELLVRTVSGSKSYLQLIYQNYPPITLPVTRGLSDFDLNFIKFVFGPRLLDNNNRRKLTLYGTYRRNGQPQDPALMDIVIYDGDIPAGALGYDLYNSALNSRLFFGTAMRLQIGTPNYTESMNAFISNCYARDGETVTQWLIDQNGQDVQPSAPPGKDATIINHVSTRWRFVQD